MNSMNIEAPRTEKVKTLIPSTRTLKILVIISVVLFVVIATVLLAVAIFLYVPRLCVDNNACKSSDLAACGCGRQKIVTGRIVGGSSTSDGEWPFQVSLQLNGHHICGATLVSCRWIVSAAHCIRNRSAENWTAVLGLHYLDQSTNQEVQKRAIKEIIIHPLATSSFDYDVALMELAHSVQYTDFVQPACLPPATASFISGRICITIGWGKTQENGSASNELLQTEVKVFNNSQCQMVMSKITKQMICAGFLEGGRDSCQGDSGGPLLCQDENSRAWMLAGIVSFGQGCGRPNRLGVYARTTAFGNWIGEKING
ncbi:enteropeptidase-like [Heptranchias perlo]|uniref:enteropeptidase-like n=1 Tax=Heptranchias perlo TaxID=212740 RepID=UPI00355A3776